MREKRWLLCFLVAMCCTFSAWALPSQDKTVTLKLHNVSIETVLDALELTGDLTYKISGRNILIYDKVEEQEWKR